jgi:hypothetical protein
MLQYIQLFGLLLITTSVFGQYISNVSVPDSSTKIISDLDIASVRYASSIRSQDLKKYLTIIASDSLQGRETGQPGINLAADYITKFLENKGLSKIPGTDSYLQPVAFTYSKWAEAAIHINQERYKHLWDFLAFPDKNENLPVVIDKEVIFLGYGIDEGKYSDYKKVDVKGKVIMINRGEPMKNDSVSYLTGSTTLSSWSDESMERKLQLAKEKGVKLVLIIDNDIKKMLEQNRRKLLGTYLELGNKMDRTFPCANHCYISSTVAKAIIGTNENAILKARKKLAKGKPAKVVLKTDLLINMLKETTLLEGNNIMGYLEGKSKKDEYVIVSAHYDHLGTRGDEVFNGADDNGSGTVSLMEIADACMKSWIEMNGPDRSIVFLWVCGEEKGLLGSEYYSENPIFPLAQTVVDVNVDMVGRVDDKYKDNPNYIYVIGSDRLSTDLHKINEEVNNKYSQITLDYTYNSEDDPNKYYYRSDHYNFAKNGIPAIFFFNGVHEDYHRPTDTVDKINFTKMEKVDKHIFHVVWELANRADRIRVDGAVKK